MSREEQIIWNTMDMCKDARDVADNIRDYMDCMKTHIEDILLGYNILKTEYTKAGGTGDFDDDIIREEDFAILQDLENVYTAIQKIELNYI